MPYIFKFSVDNFFTIYQRIIEVDKLSIYFFENMLRDEQLDKSLLSEKEHIENTQYEKAKKKLERDNKTIGELNLFQEIMFTWVHPLLSFGSKHPIQP